MEAENTESNSEGCYEHQMESTSNNVLEAKRVWGFGPKDHQKQSSLQIGGLVWDSWRSRGSTSSTTNTKMFSSTQKCRKLL